MKRGPEVEKMLKKCTRIYGGWDALERFSLDCSSCVSRLAERVHITAHREEASKEVKMLFAQLSMMANSAVLRCRSITKSCDFWRSSRDMNEVLNGMNNSLRLSIEVKNLSLEAAKLFGAIAEQEEINRQYKYLKGETK